MKEYKNIDELFREQLKDLEVTPSPSVWQHIEQSVSGVPGGSSALPASVKWLAAILATVISGIAIYYIYDKVQSDNLISERIENVNINHQPAEISAKATTISKTDVSAKANKEEVLTAENNYSTENITNNEAGEKLFTDTKPENADKNIKPTNNTHITPPQSNEDVASVTALTENTTPEAPSGALPKNAAPAKVIHKTKNVAAIDFRTLKRSPQTGFTVPGTTQKREGLPNTEQGASNSLVIKSGNDNRQVANLTSKNISVTTDNLTALFPEDATVIHNASQVSQVKKRIHSYTGISLSSGVICYQNSGEKQITWSTDGVIGMNLKKFYLETGMGYRYMRQTGNYQINYRTYDSVGYYNQVTSFEVDPNDENNIILHYKETVVYDSIHHVAFTSPYFNYRYLTFPVKIGYSFWSKKRIFMAAETGMEYNRLIKSVIPGAGFDQPGDIMNIINQTESRSLNTWKLNLGIRLGYRVNNSILFILQTDYGKYLNSIYDTEKGYIEEKPCIINFKGAVLFDF